MAHTVTTHHPNFPCWMSPPSPPAGVNDIIKEHATLLKDATGFRVLIPDLYKGKIGVDKEEAHHVRSFPCGYTPGPSLPPVLRARQVAYRNDGARGREVQL